MGIRLAIVFVWGFLFSPSLWALEIPDSPDNYVTDRANILSPAAEDRLNSLLAGPDKRGEYQIFVATFPSLEGEELSYAAIKVAEKWKIGKKGDTGVLLAIFPKERKMAIEVGYGLEAVLTDFTTARIRNQVLTPYFRAENYDEGVIQGVTALMQAIAGEDPFVTNTATPQESNSSSAEAGSIPSNIMPYVLGGLAFVWIIDLLRYIIYSSTHKGRSFRYSPWEWWFRFAFLFFLIKIFAQLALSGGSGGRGGGGFSGGGGGRFGGGGSRGGW